MQMVFAKDIGSLKDELCKWCLLRISGLWRMRCSNGVCLPNFDSYHS